MMIEVKNLSFSYEKKKQSVFNAFSLGNYEREKFVARFLIVTVGLASTIVMLKWKKKVHDIW